MLMWTYDLIASKIAKSLATFTEIITYISTKPSVSHLIQLVSNILIEFNIVFYYPTSMIKLLVILLVVCLMSHIQQASGEVSCLLKLIIFQQEKIENDSIISTKPHSHMIPMILRVMLFDGSLENRLRCYIFEI